MMLLLGGAACEACSATWNLGTNSAFALGPRKTTENLDRIGRSQDLPDTLVSSSTTPTASAPYPIVPAVFSPAHGVLFPARRELRSIHS